MTPNSPRSLYVAFEAFPRPKGASTHMASMVQALSRDFGPVLLLCLGYGDMPAFQVEGDIAIQRFKAYHPNLLKRAVAFGAFVSDVLHGTAGSLELVVFRDPWSGLPALDAGRGVPALFEVNGLPSWELGYTYPSFRANLALRTKIRDMERLCLRRANGILTVSPVTGEALRRLEPSCAPISVVPNTFHPSFGSAQEPRRLQERAEIGYVGSLHPWQGVEMAVDAFAQVADACPDVRLRIITAGRKETRKAIRKRIRKRGLVDRVRLEPALAPEALATVVRGFAFTLAPLLETPRNVVQGCCPIKVIESMAAGVPVVASDLQVTRDLITHGEDGWLVEPGKPRALAQAMWTLLQQPRLREELGRRAAARARHRHGRETIHRRLREVFKKTWSWRPAV